MEVTWCAGVLTEMALHMIDDSIDNVLYKYLEDILKRQDKEILELKAYSEALKRVITNQCELIDMLFECDDEAEKEIRALGQTILATQIQAAEAEDRADEEKRKRLALMMRI
jgi:hypothetical protein